MPDSAEAGKVARFANDTGHGLGPTVREDGAAASPSVTMYQSGLSLQNLSAEI